MLWGKRNLYSRTGIKSLFLICLVSMKEELKANTGMPAMRLGIVEFVYLIFLVI